MRLISFNAVDFPEFGGEHAMPVNARSSLIQLPNGSFDQDGSRLVLDSPTISWKATFVGSYIDEQINELFRELGKGRGILRAELRDGGATLTTYAKLKTATRNAKADGYLDLQPIQITFEQDFPFWMNDNDGWFLDSGILLDDGYVLDGLTDSQTMTVSPKAYTINYDGDARGIIGSITITPEAASTINNIQIFNAANNMSMSWGRASGPLVTGDVLVIDFLTRTCELNGSPDFGNFELADAKQVEFMVLEIGDNDITVTGDTITGTIDIDWSYRRLYL